MVRVAGDWLLAQVNFNRQFLKLRKLSPKEFRLERRLREAVERIKAASPAVAEVARFRRSYERQS